jgi:hypothetical protein
MIKEKQTKTIKEKKCVCAECKKIWHYDKRDVSENNINALGNASKALACCGGCIPALLISDKKVVDFTRCPACNSKNVKCEEISHEVNV